MTLCNHLVVRTEQTQENETGRQSRQRLRPMSKLHTQGDATSLAQPLQQAVADRLVRRLHRGKF